MKRIWKWAVAMLALTIVVGVGVYLLVPPSQDAEAAPRKMDGIEIKDEILEVVDVFRDVKLRIYKEDVSGSGGEGELDLVKGRLVYQAFELTTDADTTPSVLGGNAFTVTNSGATTVTTFDDGKNGQCIILLFTDTNTTVAETGNIFLSAAFVSTADDTLTLCFNGTNWYETARAVN